MDYNNLFGKETGEGKIPDPEKKAHNDYSHNIHRKPGPPTDEPDEIYDNHVEDHHKPAPKTVSFLLKSNHNSRLYKLLCYCCAGIIEIVS